MATRDGFLDSTQGAIEQAAITVLRDAGAFFAIEFPRNQDALAAAREQAQQRRAVRPRKQKPKLRTPCGRPCGRPPTLQEDAP